VNKPVFLLTFCVHRFIINVYTKSEGRLNMADKKKKREKKNKSLDFHMRMDDATYTLINKCAANLGVSRAEAVRLSLASMGDTIDKADGVALFGFGLRGDEAYHYIAVAGERLEVKVTPKLGAVKSVESYDNGFVVFSCEMRDEEYGDFHEVAEVTGCLDKWEPLLKMVKEVKVANE